MLRRSDFCSSLTSLLQIVQCYDTLDYQLCATAQFDCTADVGNRLAGDRDQDYILADFLDTYPPDITEYANDTARKARIGAEGDFQEESSGVLFSFQAEWMQNSRPTLESVVNDGVRTVLYTGDAVRLWFPTADVTFGLTQLYAGLFVELFRR